MTYFRKLYRKVSVLSLRPNHKHRGSLTSKQHTHHPPRSSTAPHSIQTQISLRSFQRPPTPHFARKNAHLDLRIALHDLLDARERERRVSEVGRFLLGGVDLALPEGAQEVGEEVARLDEGNWWGPSLLVGHGEVKVKVSGRRMLSAASSSCLKNGVDYTSNIISSTAIGSTLE